jgi:hypothetical protein
MTADHQELSARAICLASQGARWLSPRHGNSKLLRVYGGNVGFFHHPHFFYKKCSCLLQGLLSELLGDLRAVEPHLEGNLIHVQHVESRSGRNPDRGSQCRSRKS